MIVVVAMVAVMVVVMALISDYYGIIMVSLWYQKKFALHFFADGRSSQLFARGCCGGCLNQRG